MSKGGGGGVDTSGLEQATAQATALQKKIYEQTRGDVKPWYDMGVGSTNLLSDLLGISGGSVQSRDEIYNKLLPQYTANIPSQGGGMYRTKDGRILTFDEAVAEATKGDYQGGYYRNNDQAAQGLLSGKGYTPYQSQPTQSIDYQGLNAAIDAQLTDQTTPENYGQLLKKFSMEDFEQDPGYQFRQDEANKALERQLAAQGVTLGGAGYGEINPQAYRGMQELNQGLASQEYGAARGRYIEDQLNTFNMLMGAAGMGQNAVGIQSGAGQNYATNVGNLQTGLASAQLNAQLAQQAKPSMFSQLLGTAGQIGGAYLMSDERLKTNITPLGLENGHQTYKFAYKDNPDKYFIGVMAQDITETNPEAVVEIDGYLAVDYDAIGVTMREV